MLGGGGGGAGGGGAGGVRVTALPPQARMLWLLSNYLGRQVRMTMPTC